MTFKMKITHYKYQFKTWLKSKIPHIIAIVSTSLLLALGVYLGSHALANFIDKEFIAPTIAVNFTK
jgi:hypothetical protein